MIPHGLNIWEMLGMATVLISTLLGSASTNCHFYRNPVWYRWSESGILCSHYSKFPFHIQGKSSRSIHKAKHGRDCMTAEHFPKDITTSSMATHGNILALATTSNHLGNSLEAASPLEELDDTTSISQRQFVSSEDELHPLAGGISTMFELATRQLQGILRPPPGQLISPVVTEASPSTTSPSTTTVPPPTPPPQVAITDQPILASSSVGGTNLVAQGAQPLGANNVYSYYPYGYPPYGYYPTQHQIVHSQPQPAVFVIGPGPAANPPVATPAPSRSGQVLSTLAQVGGGAFSLLRTGYAYARVHAGTIYRLTSRTNAVLVRAGGRFAYDKSRAIAGGIRAAVRNTATPGWTN